MNSLPVRLSTACLTFIVGIGLATAWAFNRKEAAIAPVDLNPNSATLEMVFVLDTTGSMGGLLEGAKQRIWGIVNEVMQSSSHPEVKIGLVAYRDRGDQYVTQVLPLTDDLDKVYTTLMDYEAAGGGDMQEDVHRALEDGVKKVGWTQNSRNLAQVLFLVGDAPPHKDYRDEEDALVTAGIATQQGIVINTIQCGTLEETRQVWQLIAQRGQGQYFAIPQNGGVQTISTPFDEELSKLGSQLGSTFVAYGGGGGADGDKFRDEAKSVTVMRESAVATRAPAEATVQRSINKAINSKAYIGDLLQNIENGSVKLDSVKDEDLPTDLRGLSPADRKAEVDKRLGERKEIRLRIMALSKQRTDYIAAQQKKQTGGSQNRFDLAVSTALKEQLAKKGIK